MKAEEAKEDQIQAQARSLQGTGGARAIRRGGFIPGVVYGQKKDPELISVEPQRLTREYQTPGFYSKVFKLSVDGKLQLVVAKEIQLHPVTDQVLHVDFKRVSEHEKINVFVSLVFINEEKAPGIKKGGLLNIVAHRIELVCPVTSIPEKIVVDLEGFEVGQSVHAKDLKLPASVTVSHAHKDATIVTIVPSAQEDKAEG